MLLSLWVSAYGGRWTQENTPPSPPTKMDKTASQRQKHRERIGTTLGFNVSHFLNIHRYCCMQHFAHICICEQDANFAFKTGKHPECTIALSTLYGSGPTQHRMGDCLLFFTLYGGRPTQNGLLPSTPYWGRPTQNGWLPLEVDQHRMGDCPFRSRWKETTCSPSTALVEKKQMLRVSKGFSWVNSAVLVWGSDSPVSEELSTLKLWAMMTRRSAGTRSPNFTSTMSPKTSSSAFTLSFWPPRHTTANCKTRAIPWARDYLQHQVVCL